MPVTEIVLQYALMTVNLKVALLADVLNAKHLPLIIWLFCTCAVKMYLSINVLVGIFLLVTAFRATYQHISSL